MSYEQESISADRQVMRQLQATLRAATGRAGDRGGGAGAEPDAATPRVPAARPAPPARIMVVDNQTLVREALVRLIDLQPDLRVVAQAGSLREAVALARQAGPDLILIEFALPDDDGAEAVRELIAARPEARVVILTAYDDDDSLVAAFRAGASGYLLKSINTAELLSRLRGVIHGELVFSPRLGQRILSQVAHSRGTGPADRGPAEHLTTRELEILSLLVQGHTNRQIADHLKLSVRTIEYHRANLTSKLGLHSRAALIDYAKEHGLYGATGETQAAG